MIKMLVMDVDGTLTDGKIYVGKSGETMKAFNVKDGYAIANILPDYGIIPVIITGRQSKIVENRMAELGVNLLFQGIKDKSALLTTIVSDNGIAFDEVAYIGDDINDLECIKLCEKCGCPADAVNKIKECVDFVSSKCGGNGAVREFVDWLISFY